MTAQDVVFAYQFFLGREPESETVVREAQGNPPHRLYPGFIESKEFEAEVIRPALEARGRLLRHTLPLNSSMANWVRKSFGVEVKAGELTGEVLARVLPVISLDSTGPRSQPFWDDLASRLARPLAENPPNGPRPPLGKALFGTKDSLTRATLHALGRVDDLVSSHVDSVGRQLAVLSRSSPERELVERSGLWDPAFYLRQNAELEPSSDLLAHFLEQGATAGLDPHPLFSAKHYLADCLYAAAVASNPLLHYLRHGHLDDRAPNGLFSPDWYRREHLRGSTEIEPLGHYVREGARAGLSAHPLFNRRLYEELYPDVRQQGQDPYEHFIVHGNDEGRQAYDFTHAGETLKIAVVAHVFYDDLWPEILIRLNNIPVSFDLFVTLPQGFDVLHKKILQDVPNVKVSEVQNQGRDILPFLSVLPHLISAGYDAVCKVHTKRGLTEPDTWRHLLLEGVLGSPHVVRQTLALFEEDRYLTMVGGNVLYLDGDMFSSENKTHLNRLFAKIYPMAGEMPATWGFIAGTTFWFRPKDFTAMAALSAEEFTDDSRSNDGQAAHALERLFGVIPCIEGKRIGLVDISGDRASTIDVRRAPNIPSKRPLADYLRSCTRKLIQMRPELRKSARRSWLAGQWTGPGIRFIGPVEAINGLGISARGYLTAISYAQVPLSVIKWQVGFERVRRQFVDTPEHMDLPINIVHLNLDLLNTSNLIDSKKVQQLISLEHFNILMPYWELLAIPPEWISVINRFDEVWVSSSFMARAMGASTNRPVRVVRPAVLKASATSPVEHGDTIAPGRFLFAYSADSGSVMARKNPAMLWRAYAEAFRPDEGAALAIKLHYADPSNPLVQEIQALAQEREDVIYISQSLCETEMAAFFDRMDCYVSPHRSEGLGLTILEAMQAGKPVIATAYGGAADFVTPETAFVIDHHLAEVGLGAAPYPANYVWADPDPASLKKQMRTVFETPGVASAKVARALDTCEALFGADTTAEVIRSEVRRIWLSGGGSFEAFD